MIKEMLENYMSYKAEIKAKEHLIKKIEFEEVSISSPNLEVNGDIRPKGFVSSNLENKVIKNVDKVNILKKEINELQAKIDMLDSLINTLSDYHRQIIELKYKYNKSAQQIGTIVYRGKRAINKQLKIALALLDKKYKEFLESSQKVPS